LHDALRSDSLLWEPSGGAQQTQSESSVTLTAPQLFYDPAQNWRTLPMLVAEAVDAVGKESVGLMGSSMGGYYAGCLSQRYGLRAVLINPVVQPLALLNRVKGRQVHPVTGEQYTFGESDRQKFAQWGGFDLVNPEHMLLCVGMQDETLDPQIAREHLRGCRQIVDPTGGHQFPRFASALPEMLVFLFPSVA
jgi:predicted esterase YcpF (UPF0227 family)